MRSGQATHCYVGGSAGTDTIGAFADTDNDGTQNAGEPGDTGVTKRWLAQPPDTLTLAPASANYPLDTTQTLTATVTDGGTPVAGVEVIFNITSDVHGPRPPITEVTNANGVATTSYSSGVAETDTIVAFADTNLNDSQDAGEANDTGTATWSAEPPASLVLAPASDTNTIGTEHCVNGTVTEASGLTQANRRVVFSVSGANTEGGHPTSPTPRVWRSSATRAPPRAATRSPPSWTTSQLPATGARTPASRATPSRSSGSTPRRSP